MKISRKIKNSFYCREVLEVSARIVKDQSFDLSALDPQIKTLVMRSPEELEPYRSEVPSSFRDSVDRLKERLRQGCVLFVARTPSQAGAGHQIVAYSLGQRGVFSALGLKRKISPDIFFIHYTEVVAGMRRNGMAKLILSAVFAYCKKYGLEHTVTVGSQNNRLSQQAFRQNQRGRRSLGTVEKVSILRGLVVWHTPWDKVLAAIGNLRQTDASKKAISAVDLVGAEGAEANCESRMANGGFSALR